MSVTDTFGWNMSKSLNLDLFSEENMKGQPFSTAQLSALTTASSVTLSATEFVDMLSDHEAEVTLLSTSNNSGADVELISNFYASYLIALLLVDDLNEARFLTQRFPSQLSDTDHTLLKVKRLLRDSWSEDYTSVFQILQRTEWPDLLKPLADRYFDHFQRKAYARLGNAYTSVTPQTASVYLRPSADPEHGAVNGNTSAEKVVTEQLLQKGWTFDAEHNLLRPAIAAKVDMEHGTVDSDGTYSTGSMASLIELVGFLGE